MFRKISKAGTWGQLEILYFLKTFTRKTVLQDHDHLNPVLKIHLCILIYIVLNAI